MRRATLDLAILAALALLTNFVYFAYSNGDFFYPDSATYIAPAKSMLQGRGFVRANGIVETFRTPGYPILLMPLIAATHDYAAVVVILQHLLNVALVMAVYLFARRRFSRGIAFAAAAIVAIDTPTIHYANKVLTETVFTVGLFALVVFALRGLAAGGPQPAESAAENLRGPRAAGRGPMIAMGLLAGALVIVRPVAILYFGVLAFLFVLQRRKHVALFVVAALVLPLGWAARNRVRTGVYAIADVAGVNMLMHRAAPALAIFDDYDFEEALRDRQDELSSDADTEIERTLHIANAGSLNPAQHARWFGRIGRRIALQHPVGMIVLHTRGVLVNLFDSDWDSIQLISVVPASMLQVVIEVWTHAITLLALLGTFVLWRRDRTLSLLITLTLAYFVVISAGSEAEARFRVPVVPLMAIAAAVGGGRVREVSVLRDE